MPGKKAAFGWAKAGTFVVCLLPAGLLAWRALHNQLGGNPIEAITHKTGDWTIRFLLITLTITPARRLLNLPDLIRFRRMLGLFAFFYGCLHLMTYVWLDQFFDWPGILKDVAKRPFILAGFTGFMLMVPLAITSTRGWVRRLGGRRWQQIHRLIYFSALAGVIHYYWLVKSDIRLPLLYGAIWAALMGYRVVFWLRPRTQKKAPHRSAGPVDEEPKGGNPNPKPGIDSETQLL